MTDRAWNCRQGPGPLVAVALNNGHHLRKDLDQIIALDEEARLREEDLGLERELSEDG